MVSNEQKDTFFGLPQLIIQTIGTKTFRLSKFHSEIILFRWTSLVGLMHGPTFLIRSAYTTFNCFFKAMEIRLGQGERNNPW